MHRTPSPTSPAVLVSYVRNEWRPLQLPEAALNNELLATWRQILRDTHSIQSELTWILVGTGPVTVAGPRVSELLSPPNRAVLVFRDGSILLTQDKRCGFSLQPGQVTDYRLDEGLGGGSNLGEYITHGIELNYVDASAGRFAVAICEDHARLVSETGSLVAAAGVTHLMVPVIAPAMWEEGWQARRAEVLAEELGCTVIVSNGLAIDQYNPYKPGEPAATLIATIPPPGSAYGRSRTVLKSCDATDPRVNSLQPRTISVPGA